jgi:malic enzyme
MQVYPRSVLQWEDFLKENAITQLERFRDFLCTFNDDIQGTAATVLAGVYTAMRVTGTPMSAQRMVLAGAGASAQGIADLFVSALVEAGLSREDARRRICTVDSRGLVTQGRQGLEPFKARYARPDDEVRTFACADSTRISLEETIRNFRPTVLIGASGTPGLFTEPVILAMTSVAERPVIFPLSNPTSKSECTADEAVRWSGGRAIVATGSPFAPVEYGGTRQRIGQSNNSFIFPGVGLGLWAGRVTRVTDGMCLDAARALADQVTARDLEEGAVYPALGRIRACSVAVACAVIRRAMREQLTDRRLDGSIEDLVTAAMWVPAYRPAVYEPADDLVGAH